MPQERVWLRICKQQTMQWQHVESSSCLLCLQGDIRDQTLLAISLAVLVLFSMQLTRIYLHTYDAAGFRPIREMLRH